MKHSFLRKFFLLAFVLLPLIRGDDLIDETCKKTPFYDLCQSSLRSVNGSSAADVKSLALLMATITLLNAVDTLNFTQELINKTEDPDVERRLTFCAETYIPVVKFIIPQAMDALTKDQYEFANYGISDVGKETDSCESKLSGKIESPLTEMNQRVHNLSDITVAIINILQKD